MANDAQGAGPDSAGSTEQEIRIAVVMTGGVSLAVWMGGVVAELYRAIVRAPGVYSEILDTMQSRVRVDIVSGSSAGGLNGVLLAQALARDLTVNEIDQIRDVWLNDGAMTTLLRSPFEPDPPSLMRGDEYFLPQIEAVLKRWKNLRPAQWTNARGNFDLIVTATLLRPEIRRFRDDLDEVIEEDDHRGRFSFTKAHLSDDGVVPLLARAARTSASFPGAFEASYWKAPEPVLGGAARVANFSGSRFAIDGGVLANMPVEPALDKLYGRSADHDTRRVLAYVSPDPGGSPPGGPPTTDDDPKATPSLMTVVADSFTLPSKQSIAGDLARLHSYNQEIVDQIERRSSLLGATSPEVLIELAQGSYPVFFDQHRKQSVARMVEAVLENMSTPSESLGTSGWKTAIDRLADARGDSLPDAFPDVAHTLELMPGGDDAAPAAPTTEPWEWGIAPLEYATSIALDLVRRAFALVPLQETERLATLGALRADIHHVRERVDLVRKLDGAYWQARFDSLPAPQPGFRPNADTAPALPTEWSSEVARQIRFPEVPAAHAALDELVAWATESYAQWPGERDENLATEVVTALNEEQLRLQTLGIRIERDGESWQRTTRRLLEALAIDLARILIGASLTLIAAAYATDAVDRVRRDELSLPRAQQLGGLINGLLLDNSEPAAVAVVVQRMLALYVIQAASCGDAAFREQPIDFVQFSANTRCDVDDTRTAPAQKLTGLRLHHFGAFFKESWRANDWMWGRLDGAGKLIQTILQPERFARVVPADAAGARVGGYRTIMGLALGTAHTGPPAAVLYQKWRDVFSARVWAELAYLDDANEAVPASLAWCSRAIAFRRQIEIGSEELPLVADAVERSEVDGGAMSATAYSFMRRTHDVSPKGTTPEAEVPRLLQACKVGEETLHEEVGYDLFTRTTSTALAVGANALRGERSGLGKLRHLLQSVRAPVLAVWLLAQSSARTSRAAFAFTTLLLAFGGAVIALPILGTSVPPVILTAAILALAAWFLTSAVMVRAVVALFPIGIAALVIGASQLDSAGIKQVIGDQPKGAAPGWKDWVDSNGVTIGRILAVLIVLAVVFWLLNAQRHAHLSQRIKTVPGALRYGFWTLLWAFVALALTVWSDSIRTFLFHGDATTGTRGHVAGIVGSMHRYEIAVVLLAIPITLIFLELLRSLVLRVVRRAWPRLLFRFH